MVEFISILPVSEVHPDNASHILVTLLGITGVVLRSVHPPNVLCIFVTLFGIIGAVVREVHPYEGCQRWL